MSAALGFGLLGLAALVAPVPWRRGAGGQSRPVGTPERRAAALPLLAGAASAVGWIWLTGTATGAVGAAVMAPLAALVERRLERRPARVEPDPALPLVLDLAATALRSGRPLAEALALAAPAAGREVAALLDRVAALSRLGADAEQAWSSVPRAGPLGEVAVVVVRSAASGLKLASGLERLAADIRAERAAAAAARAHRAGVVAMAPLAACFLPSFVCLGIVPVLVGVARSALTVLH